MRRLMPLHGLDEFQARARLNLLHPILSNALAKPLTWTLAAGWAAGEREAIRLLGTVGKSAQTEDYWVTVTGTLGLDWAEWDAEDLDAAGIVHGDGLRALLEQVIGQPWNEAWSERAADRGSLLASITDNRLDTIAEALADNLAAGGSVDELDRALRGLLDDPAWSEVIASTETARAMTAATLASYGANGVPGKRFLSAEDTRVCSLCDTNEGVGAIPVGSDFPYGDPPTHPSCRCVLLPDLLPDSDLPSVPDLNPLDVTITEE